MSWKFLKEVQIGKVRIRLRKGDKINPGYWIGVVLVHSKALSDWTFLDGCNFPIRKDAELRLKTIIKRQEWIERCHGKS